MLALTTSENESRSLALGERRSQAVGHGEPGGATADDDKVVFVAELGHLALDGRVRWDGCRARQSGEREDGRAEEHHFAVCKLGVWEILLSVNIWGEGEGISPSSAYPDRSSGALTRPPCPSPLPKTQPPGRPSGVAPAGG